MRSKFAAWRSAAAIPMGCGLALTLGLGGCGTDDDPGRPGGGVSISITPSPPPPSSVGDPVRDAIIAAMQDESPSITDLASNKDTVIKELPATALKEWKVLELTLDVGSHPQRSIIGLAVDGRVLVLDAQPDNFAELTEGAQVTSDQQAVELAQTYIQSTGDLTQPMYPVSSFDDITFLPSPSADESTQIAEVKRDHGQSIKPPSAAKTSEGWTVSTWWKQDRQLIKHEVSIRADGSLQDSPSVVADRLPVPVSP